MRSWSIHMLLAAALVLLAVGLRIIDPGPVARARMAVFDTYLDLAPRPLDAALPVRIVDVDEPSLARLGQWPWPRSRLAEIIANLTAAGARTVTLDLILAEPDRLSPGEFARLFAGDPALAPLIDKAAALPSNDERLATVLAASPSIVGLAGERGGNVEPPAAHASFAVAGDDPLQFAPRFPGAVSSLPVLAAAAKGFGAVNWLPERDQVVRRIPLLLSIGGKLYPSLPLEALRVAKGESTIFVRSSGASRALAFGQSTGIENIRVGTTVLPTDGTGEMWLRFTRPDARRYISAYRVLDGSLDAGEVAGRDVLIGTSAAGLLDLRATPLDPAVPGVEVHAQALEQMLGADHLVRPSFATGAEILYIIAIGAALAWLTGRLGAAGAAGIGAAAVAALFATSWFAYTGAGYLLDPVYPSIAVLLIYLATSLSGYIATERERARVRSAFGHYVAAPLVEELARNHDKLKLGGETRQVTVLFADVRGFTNIAEGLSAEELIAFLNHLFTPLSDIILEERGTIDKFMGDAVMAFWNAPLREAAHATSACRTALRMQDEVARLNETWAQEAAVTGQAAPRVALGIGLNTGDCCVGNVGSPQRFDYSILGDAVNVASRLEGLTKTYGVPVIAGETTAVAASSLAFIEIAAVKVRGKERPERIFALLGDERVATSEDFVKLAAAHVRLLAAIKTSDAEAASAMLAECRALGGPPLARLYATYETQRTLEPPAAVDA